MTDPYNQTQGTLGNAISPTIEINVGSSASSGNGGNQQNGPSKTYGSKKLKKNKSGVSSQVNVGAGGPDKHNQTNGGSSKKIKKKGSSGKHNIRTSRLSTQEGEGGIPGIISSCEREREGGVRSSMQIEKKAKS